MGNFGFIVLLLIGGLHAEIVEGSIQFNGVRFRVARIAPQKVQVFWKNEQSQPYGSFDHDQIVNFWDFAGLFLQLNCQNALFLDGQISQMSVNPKNFIRNGLSGEIIISAE